MSLRQEREDLELKVTALRSPRRLEGIAKSKFGLGTPRSDQVIHLGSRPWHEDRHEGCLGLARSSSR